MAQLRIEDANKAFGDTAVLRNIDLAIADGEFVVVVGPSGCGKSTLLRIIAGLEDLDSGTITIGDRAVDRLPPTQRGIAMVFQSYALYPHLTCYENIAFALRLAKRPKGEVEAAVARAAEILGLHDVLDRKPASLSGGQRQRVAIGRAIVRQPDIFLFDEPLSNLDAALRVRMRFEFAALHRTLATTTVYVTHDQVEAMTLADRIVLMRDGRIEQTGSPNELYERPANLFVAGFLGSPAMNLLGGTVERANDGPATIRLDSDEPMIILGKTEFAAGTRLTIGIRPDEIERAAPASAGACARKVQFVERLGGAVVAHLGTSESHDELVWQTRDATDIVEGETLWVRFPPDRIHLFDADGLAIR